MKKYITHLSGRVNNKSQIPIGDEMFSTKINHNSKSIFVQRNFRLNLF